MECCLTATKEANTFSRNIFLKIEYSKGDSSFIQVNAMSHMIMQHLMICRLKEKLELQTSCQQLKTGRNIFILNRSIRCRISILRI